MDEYITFSFSTLLVELRKNLKKIIIFIFSFTVIASIVVFLIPNQYESNVILTRSYLLYFPEKVDVYKPMEYYKNFAMSDNILNQVIERVKEENILKDDLVIKRVFSAELFYKPISGKEKVEALKLTVIYGDPEVAAKIVNIWGSLVIKNSSLKFSKNVFGDIEYTVKSYEDEEKKLSEYQNEKSKIVEYYTEKIGKERSLWDRKINLFVAQNPIELWKDEVTSMEDKLIELEDELVNVKREISTLDGRIGEGKKRIKDVEKFFKLKKSIDENGLWTLLGSVRSKKELLDGIKRLNLKVEELNPAYTTLLVKISEDMVKLKGFKNEKSFLDKKIVDLKEKISLKRKLIAEKEFLLNNMRTEKNKIISGLKSEMSGKINAVEIKIGLIKDGLKELKDKYLIAHKIQMGNFSDISVALWGSPPLEKSFPPRFLMIMVSILLAFFIAIFYLFLKTLLRE